MPRAVGGVLTGRLLPTLIPNAAPPIRDDTQMLQESNHTTGTEGSDHSASVALFRVAHALVSQVIQLLQESGAPSPPSEVLFGS